MTETQVAKWGVEVEAGWKSPNKKRKHSSNDLVLDCCGAIATSRARRTIDAGNQYNCSSCGSRAWEYYIRDEDFCCDDCDGGYIELPKSLVCGWDFWEDGSLDGYKKAVYLEVVTVPPTDKRENLLGDLQKLWKQISDVNHTMGFHVHTSFKRLATYKYLYSWEFVSAFQRKVVERFPELSSRMTNQYCQKWGSQIQMRQNYNNRYHAVNFFPAWRSHGTYEFRIFGLPRAYSRASEYIRFLDREISKFVRLADDEDIAPDSIFSDDTMGGPGGNYTDGTALDDNGRKHKFPTQRRLMYD